MRRRVVAPKDEIDPLHQIGYCCHMSSNRIYDVCVVLVS